MTPQLTCFGSNYSLIRSALMRESLTLRGSEESFSSAEAAWRASSIRRAKLTVHFHARVLGKIQRHPALKNGIRCVGMRSEDEDEPDLLRLGPGSWTANSRRSEIYLFGGEQRLPSRLARLKVLNEHLVYRPVENRWIRLGGGTLPTPRPQAIICFVFGGEFATPTESQFHHYDDILVLDRKVASVAPKLTPASRQPGPLSRSGHRMLALKRPHEDLQQQPPPPRQQQTTSSNRFAWQPVEILGQRSHTPVGLTGAVNPFHRPSLTPLAVVFDIRTADGRPA
uniref:Adipose-secreted signaling protein n=1 Tax=Macrostomum lignano TaxID=282301 RepID=A0A1I8F4Z6_9PLAT